MNYTIKNIIFVLVSTLLLFSSFSFADDKYLDCKEAYDKKDYASAISCLRDALKKEKTDPTGFIWLGKALLAIDSAEAATPPLFRAKELDSANAEVNVLIGDAYVMQKIPGAAVAYYLKATEIDSTNADYFGKLAESYMSTRQYTEAAFAYRKALARDTTNLSLFQKLGNLYYLAKQYVNAVPFLAYFVNHDASAAKEKLQLVNAMYQTNRLSEMIPYAQSILSAEPNNLDVLRMLALAYVRNQNYSEAEATFLSLEKIDTLKASDYIELGKAQKSLEKTDLAIASFEKAFQKDSTVSTAFYDLGTLYMNIKRYEDAARMFEKKIEADTSANFRFACHLNAGLCLMQIKNFKGSLDHIKASLELRPDYVTAWNSLAACYAQMDSTSRQREVYKKEIDLILAGGDESIEKYKRQIEEAYRIEGFFLLTDQKFSQALSNFQKASQYDAKNCDNYFGMAQAYYFLKNTDDAKKYLCKTLSMCPKNEDAKKFGASIGLDCK